MISADALGGDLPLARVHLARIDLNRAMHEYRSHPGALSLLRQVSWPGSRPPLRLSRS